MKEDNNKKLSSEWFGRADEDWGVAQLLYDEKSYPAASCYHCHQAAEKYLNGFLVFNRKDIENEFKIHSLIKLFDYCKELSKGLNQEVKKSCYFLNKYYIETRYPGEIEEYSWSEVGKALKAINAIRDKILKICNIF